MNRYSLTAIALICLVALVQLVVSRQFAGRIETLRSNAWPLRRGLGTPLFSVVGPTSFITGSYHLVDGGYAAQ